jgi:hypothetical protein
MLRQPRKVDPRRTYIVVDGQTPITPAFYHPELTRAWKQFTALCEGWASAPVSVREPTQ